VETVDELGRLVQDEHGLVLTFHPHADSVIEYARQIDRLLDDTDPRVVQLCLDTGHVEYRDGDSVALVRERLERIAYLHLKSLDGALRAKVNADDLDFATAVRLGVMCEPEGGVVDFAAIDAALGERAWDGWAIVEQDMFPLADLARPLPIARRTRHYFHQLGWTT
jgi:inosose dehydratase